MLHDFVQVAAETTIVAPGGKIELAMPADSSQVAVHMAALMDPSANKALKRPGPGDGMLSWGRPSSDLCRLLAKGAGLPPA